MSVEQKRNHLSLLVATDTTVRPTDGRDSIRPRWYTYEHTCMWLSIILLHTDYLLIHHLQPLFNLTDSKSMYLLCVLHYMFQQDHSKTWRIQPQDNFFRWHVSRHWIFYLTLIFWDRVSLGSSIWARTFLCRLDRPWTHRDLPAPISSSAGIKGVLHHPQVWQGKAEKLESSHYPGRRP